MILNQIFKRWDIGFGNERTSFFHCRDAVKIKRALRLCLPMTGYVHANQFEGQMLLRLAQVNYNPDIRMSVEKMQNEVYGGAAYRVNVDKLRKALAA